ncbi:MAG: hypothetical protein ACRD3Q_13570 [Terriglobales bacterium]
MTTHNQRAARMYGGKSLGSGASYEHHTGSYYSRRIAALNARNDTEEVALARAEEKQVEAFARKWKIPPEDVAVVLDRLRDHEAFPRSQESLKTRRDQTLEQLRIELGGAEAARKAIEAAVRVTTDLAQTIPGLAARANATGAGEDGVLLKTLAKDGEQPTPAA